MMNRPGGDDRAVSEDLLLGGRVRLRQPLEGYRAAIDPVLAAAAIDARAGSLVLDAGLGTGALALCLLARRPDLRVIGVETAPAMAALARHNAAANGCGARLEVRLASLESATAAMAAAGEHVDAVATNPPYLAADRADRSPSPSRQQANVEEQPLRRWVAACARPLRAKGSLVMVHRADRLDEALEALRGAGFGETAVIPLWPRAGAEARRVLLRARKGVAGAARLLPGLVLHRPDGAYTTEAEAVLRDAAPIAWKVSTTSRASPT